MAATTAEAMSTSAIGGLPATRAALTGGGAASTTPSTQSAPLAPAGVSPSEHEAHHR